MLTEMLCYNIIGLQSLRNFSWLALEKELLTGPSPGMGKPGHCPGCRENYPD